MRRRHSGGSSVLLSLVVIPLWVAPALAQRQPPPPPPPPSVPVVPRPSNIGGFPTLPVAPKGQGPARWIPSPATNGSWVWVADAPVTGAAVVVYASDEGAAAAWRAPRVTWTPTAERPRWVRDSSVTPVQAWRDLIVSDVVCNSAGTCLERRQRIRARWLAACACYAFADGWNRVWRVE